MTTESLAKTRIINDINNWIETAATYPEVVKSHIRNSAELILMVGTSRVEPLVEMTLKAKTKQELVSALEALRADL